MLRFLIIRMLERRLSVQNLYRVLMPFVFMRATVNSAFKDFRPPVPLPECLQATWTRRLYRQQRMNGYLNRILDYFPDQLAGPKWRDRCRINGLDRLQQAQQDGRTVVLAFVHLGPYMLIRTWLRSAGIAVAIFSGGKPENRWKMRRRLDKYFPFPKIPTVFFLNQLREAPTFLAAGNPLCMAMDNPRSEGKQMDVPFCEGWTFRMTTGAVRLAIRHQTELIPATMIYEGRWRFRLELGQPVPKEFLATEADLARAGKYLLDEIMPHMKAHPELCGRDLILCLKKTAASI
jgi:lauroyl/myristoyl acyltransferase